MSIQRKLRRGNKATSDSFTGAVGETVFETDNNRLVNHDGSKAGGYPVPNFLDAINNAFSYAASSGTNTITASLAYAPTAYTAGMSVIIKPANTISGAATINLNSLGAKNIKKDDGSGTLVSVASGDIKANIPVGLIYDGTQFVLQSGGGGTDGNVQVFTSSGTYTPTAGMRYCMVEVIGGGGGGGGAAGSSNSSAGAGGGSGAYSRSILSAADVGASQSVTIGAAGSAGSTSGGNGGAGGASSLGSLVTANGGSGGGGDASGGGSGGTGGAGGTAGTGQLARAGCDGGDAVPQGTNGINSGVGASSVYGSTQGPGWAPGNTVDAAVTGQTAQTNSGSGGSGGAGASAAGGAGGSGIVIVTEFM